MNKLASYLGVESNLEYNEMLFWLSCFAAGILTVAVLYVGGFI